MQRRQSPQLPLLLYRQDKERREDMEERLNIWFDEEGDFLEIGLEKKKDFSEILVMTSGRE